MARSVMSPCMCILRAGDFRDTEAAMWRAAAQPRRQPSTRIRREPTGGTRETHAPFGGTRLDGVCGWLQDEGLGWGELTYSLPRGQVPARVFRESPRGAHSGAIRDARLCSASARPPRPATRAL